MERGVWRFDYEVFPIGSWIEGWVPSKWYYFGRYWKLPVGVLLEEVGHQGWDFQLLSRHLLLSLFFLTWHQFLSLNIRMLYLILGPQVTDDCGLKPLKSQVTSFPLLNCLRDLSHAWSLTNLMSKAGGRVKWGRKAEAEKRRVPTSTLPWAQSLADLGRLCASAQDDPWTPPSLGLR